MASPNILRFGLFLPIHKKDVIDKQPQLPSNDQLSGSEVMTIVIAFYGSGHRIFKDFDTLGGCPHWYKAFPN